MQKQNYREFRDQQNQSELQNYQQNIPVGQPISHHQFQPQHPQHHPVYPNQIPMQYQQMPPPMMQPPPPMIIQAPPQQMIQNYGFPIQIQCPCCKNNVPTIVNHESGNTTYLWCAFIMCCLNPACCCIPFLMDSCLDKSHYCPNCGHNILRKHQKCFQFINC